MSNGLTVVPYDESDQSLEPRTTVYGTTSKAFENILECNIIRCIIIGIKKEKE